MRCRAVSISVVLSLLVLVLAVPSGVAARSGPGGVVRTDFVGFVFPAGYPGTPTSCSLPPLYSGSYVSAPLPACVLDPGKTTALAGGRALIRDEIVVDASFAWHSLADIAAFPTGPNEPRRTGYNVESFNAIFDATFSGPVWGTWKFYDFTGQLMFTGAFIGSFENGQPSIHSAGIGNGTYRGQSVWMDIFAAPAGAVNMAGYFLGRAS